MKKYNYLPSISAFAVVVFSFFTVACDNRPDTTLDEGSVKRADPNKPGHPQVPANQAGENSPAGETGTRADYQPSTGQGGQAESRPEDEPEGENPAPNNPNTQAPPR